MKTFIFVLACAACLLTGCTTLQHNESYENLLNKAKKPIHIVSVYNQNGMVYVLFKDAGGKFFTINGLQFYSLQPGEVFY